MQISKANTHLFKDKTWKEVFPKVFGNNGEIRKKLNAHAEKREKVLLFVYISGHGFSHNGRQSLVMNDSKQVLLNVEDFIRLYLSNQWCSVFIVYDCCRSDSSSLKKLLEIKGGDKLSELEEQQNNIYSVYGTIPGDSHPADSTLARDLLDLMLQKSSQNNGLITFPEVFQDYCGQVGKATKEH